MRVDTGHDFATLQGKDRVRLDGSVPAKRPCRWCGSEAGYHTGPVAQHHDGIRCAGCDRHLGWLPNPHDDPSLIED